MSSTQLDDTTKQVPCVGNWPGYLMWNVTYEKRELAILVLEHEENYFV